MSNFNAKDVELNKYKKNYSEGDFWDKIMNVASKAGKSIIQKALTLYYAMSSDKVSMMDKVKIMGALGYFICPVDAIPDIIPALGFTDDAAVLMFVIGLLNCIDAKVKAQADRKIKDWF